LTFQQSSVAEFLLIRIRTQREGALVLLGHLGQETLDLLLAEGLELCVALGDDANLKLGRLKVDRQDRLEG